MPDKELEKFRQELCEILGEDVEVTEEMLLEFSDGRGQDNER